MRLHRLSCVVTGGGLILGAAALGHGAAQSGAALEATPGDKPSQVVTVQLPAGAIDMVRSLGATPAQNPTRGRSAGGVDKAETILLAESFEGSWPAPPWRVSHPDGAADVDWGRTDYRASDGSHSIWCAQSGSESPGEGGLAPTNSSSWVVAGPFDLTEATAGSLVFDLWLQTEQFHDLFMWLVSTDGESFSGEATSTDSNGWSTIAVDLTAWGEVGNVTGHPQVWIAFVYQSDHNNRLEGAYVDNVSLVADSGSQISEPFTYTTDEDFALGAMVGVESATDALQLSADWSTLPFIWVPNTGTGTVSKVDTETGDELGRYRTGPDRELEPAVAAVDLHGACWVGNRGAGTVVKVALLENGDCVDRNSDGDIDTSVDSNDDGDITGDELLAWGADECVLFEVVLVADEEGTYIPGEDHNAYARNGLRALAVDAESTVWAGVYDSSMFYRVDGQTGDILEFLDVSTTETRPSGLVVDHNGMLWSASWPDAWVLRAEPVAGELDTVDLNHGSSGLALDEDEHLFVTGFADSRLSRVDVGSDEVDWTIQADWQAHGVAVTNDGDVWVGATGSRTVKRYSNDGQLEASIPVINGPTGVAVDDAGMVWVVGLATNVIVRIDPAINQANLEKTLVASVGHDATGDLTGIVARSVTTRYGTWSVIHDSLVADTAWGTISWDGSAPDETTIAVRVASSNDLVSWSSWEQAANGVALSATPAGRHLRIEAALQDLSGLTTPVLDELTVAPEGADLPPQADFSWSPAEPGPGQSIVFTDTSTGDPTSWSWTFGDGGTSNDQHPTHAYADAGTYAVTLEVTNDSGSDSESRSLTVSGSGPATCSLAYWVPVASHATGALDSVWRTDLGLLGVGDSTAAVELRFYGPQGIATRAVSVGPQAMVDIVDVVDWISTGTEASAALEVCTDGILVVTSRTYNQLGSDHPCTPDGSFGQRLDGAASSEGLSAGDVVVLPQLRENAAFRTNLGLVNTDPDPATVVIGLYDATGTMLTTYAVELASGQWWQDNRPFFNRAGVDDLGAGWARVAVGAGRGVFAYASVIDNVTNDATTVPMRR